ncbi:MAG: hypothetical protein NZ899_08630 [Thermoguttaceae bacterium]|nr:hypothetical protein [Thermoguttaceae bacterium]MDW8077990.1 transglutaminase domain-containing protein [Thermoguttaceae bacterium]
MSFFPLEFLPQMLHAADGSRARRPAGGRETVISSVNKWPQCFIWLFCGMVISSWTGCSRSQAPEDIRVRADVAMERARHDEALEYALQTLRDIEEYDLPETFRQMIDRLDQWIETQKPLESWRVDPLVETLPENLRKLVPQLGLDRLRFDQEDGVFLREVVWLRNIANWAPKGAVDPLSQATALFDWVVRNIQLEAPPALAPGSEIVRVFPFPWEVILFGRGTANDRAWVLVLLLRQLGIDAGVVGVIRTESLGGQRIDPWAVGVLVDKKIYLYEPTLGVPIPGPDSPKLDPEGQLQVRPATLEEVVADPSLLRKLDLPHRRYPLQAEDLREVVFFVDGSPGYLAQRMFLLQARVAGKLAIVLTASPSEIAERFRGLPHIKEVRLFPLPYQALENARQLGQQRSLWLLQNLQPFILGREYGSPLWKARQYHFRGIFEGDLTASMLYQDARAPERQIREQKLEPALANLLREVKLYASYWLGIVAAEQGNYVSAEDYLLQRVLKAFGGGPVLPGAVYNLARVYEAQGKIREAIDWLRADRQSAAAWGNSVRAFWLEQLHPTAAAQAGQTAQPAAAESEPVSAEANPPPTTPSSPATSPSDEDKPQEESPALQAPAKPAEKSS